MNMFMLELALLYTSVDERGNTFDTTWDLLEFTLNSVKYYTFDLYNEIRKKSQEIYDLQLHTHVIAKCPV